MPKEIFDSGYKFLEKQDLLSFEEIVRIIKELESFGLNKIRLTGGEPLLRKNIEQLIYKIKTKTNIKHLALTTNGSLLTQKKVRLLQEVGLDSITISLDSLNSDINKRLNPLNDDKNVVDSIYTTLDIFNFVKINIVVMKDINDSEVFKIIDTFKDTNAEMRFIEFMDVGETNKWNINQVVKSEDLVKRIAKKFKIKKELPVLGSTSQKWKLLDHQSSIAFISSISKPFCNTCNRGRLSADGKFYTCLFSTNGHNLLKIIRNSHEPNVLKNLFFSIWSNRLDKYSLIRSLNKDIKINTSKIEMSYIGG
jgi:cyclic pyranopterin phosphate synthase